MKQKNRFMICLFIGMISFAAVTICSKCSFLYPFNDWVDINCFMTVGKGMTRGFLPYRDLFEQKGPVLYFLSEFAATVSSTSFRGFWILEIVSGFFFLLYFWKTLCLLSPKAWPGWIPVTALMIYTSGAFFHGGSAEELCLPFFAYAVYIGTWMIQKQGDMKLSEMFAIGLTSGLVLWIKFSMLGIYVGWIIVPFYMAVKKKQIVSFMKGILMIVLGVAAVSLPVLFWFYRQGALEDMMEVYFYNNIFIYAGGESVVLKLIHIIGGFYLALISFGLPFLIAVFGIIYYMRKSTLTALFYMLSGLLFSIAAFSGRFRFMYYMVPYSVFTVIGTAALNDLFVNRNCRLMTSKSCLSVLTAVCVVGMFFLSPNVYLMKCQKKDLPQFQFKKIICQAEDPTLLNYGFMDGGFYTACGICPEYKYFFKANIDLPEMFEAQDEYIAHRDPMYVVTRSDNPDLDGYDCIAESNFFYEGETRFYYLYRRRG